jgi:hypothetical protein
VDPATSRRQRSAKNYLLKPMVQVRIGLYSITLGFMYVVGLVGVLYATLSRVYTLVQDLTPDDAQLAHIVEAGFRETAIYVVALSLVFIVSTVFVSVVYTHRLVGPTFAFRRHLKALREGRYEVRTALRKDDAFVEVADELNALSETLERSRGAAGPPAAPTPS